MYNRYRLIDYFDVWGNSKDGYEVNNLCCVFDDLYLSDDCTDKEILNYLKDIGYLSTSDMRKVRLINYCDYFEIEQIKGNYPIGRLEIVEQL